MMIFALATGCGDPLLNVSSIDDLVDTPAPAEPAWNVRWLQEGSLAVDCRIEEIENFEQTDLVLGELELPAPERIEPPVWVDESEAGYSYALGLLTIVDEEVWEIGEQELSQDEALELALGVGTWGVSESWALLYVQGDMDAAAAELLVGDGDEGLTLEAGEGWVKWLSAVVDITQNAESALLPSDAGDVADIERLGVAVTALRHADEATERVITAEALDDVTFLNNCEPDDEDDD